MKRVITFLLLPLLLLFFSSVVSKANAAVSLDSSFGTNGTTITSFGHNAVLGSMTLQADGKMVTVGGVYNGSNYDWEIARYNTDGTLDSTFGSGGLVTKDLGDLDVLYAVAIQQDGKILVGGESGRTCVENLDQCWTLARYNPDGTPDTTFGNNGFVITDLNAGSYQNISRITVQSDGKIIAIGGNGNNSVAVRYNSDGTLDTSFGSGGIVTIVLPYLSNAGGVKIQPTDGKIVIDIGAAEGHISVVRLNTDGSLDSTFGTGGIFTINITYANQTGDMDLLLQPDGKIVVVGDEYTLTTSTSPSVTSTILIRLTTGGVFDSTFNGGNMVVNNFSGSAGVSSGVLLSDGSILVGGYQMDVPGSGNSIAALRKFRSDGSLDTTFGTNGSFISPVEQVSGIRSVVLQTNGKLDAFGGASSGGDTGWFVSQFTGIVSNNPPSISSIPPAFVNEGDAYAAAGSFTDPDSTSWTATVDYGDGSGAQPLTLSGTNFSLSHVYADNGTFTVTVSVTDNQGATGTATTTVTVNNVAPTVGAISASVNPVLVNNATVLSANFTDPGVLDTHTAVWDWGDGSTSSGTVTETNGSGSISDSHIYANTGVYQVTLTVTDKDGGVGSNIFQYVSVYNPTAQGIFSAGSVYTSPVGALIANSSATGKVMFGLSYKYQGTVPTGNRQFSMDFNNANFQFNATTVNSLVISNGIGTLTGTGTVNGSGTYNFLVTGSESADTIRIQIMDSSGNAVYDTQPGAATNAIPVTAVTGTVLAH